MPAGYSKKRCRNCYLRSALRKRLDLHAAALSSSEVSAGLRAFGAWLAEDTGAAKAPLSLTRHATFFDEIDRTWQRFPSYEELLESFGAARLRKAELPMRWLAASGRIVPDADAKARDTERRRTADVLGRLPAGSASSKTLHAYHAYLEGLVAAERTTPRSSRQALAAAAALLERSPAKPFPSRTTLELHVSAVPGQRATLHRFVSYLVAEHGADLQMPAARKGRASTLERRRFETEAVELVQRGLDPASLEREWIVLALRIFHDIPRKTGRRLVKASSYTVAEDGYYVRQDDSVHYVPKRSPSQGGDRTDLEG